MTTRLRFAEESLRVWHETLNADWIQEEGSEIAEFFRGKCVFVTGATGFLGKLLLEKLLRACYDLETIFVLVRPKKGQNENYRMEAIFEDPVFGLLHRTHPKFRHKIQLIQGDIEKPQLGISPQDMETLTNQVNVIFHIAATVRFDEQMTRAVNINVRSTRDLLLLARQCRDFRSFVHISTAYTNCNQSEIEERLYAPPMPADELIQLAETMPEEELTAQAPTLIRDWPNNYTFTKAVAENAVQLFSKGIPACIFRPSIVISTYKEPVRGWIDNFYGATGVVVGFGTGVLKSMHCDRHKAAEMVPGDYVINSMITAAYKTALDNHVDDVTVYNYVSSVENRVTWEHLMEQVKLWGCEVPTVRAIWYHTVTLNKYKWVHDLYDVFLHFVPGFFMDLMMMASGKKPIMVKLYKKIHKFESVIAHFATMEWRFRNDNTQKLWQSLGAPDRKMFPFSMRELDWVDYYKGHVLGLRVYAVKDDLSTLDQARRKYAWFYRAHVTVKTLFYLFLIWLAFKLYRLITHIVLGS